MIALLFLLVELTFGSVIFVFHPSECISCNQRFAYFFQYSRYRYTIPIITPDMRTKDFQYFMMKDLKVSPDSIQHIINDDLVTKVIASRKASEHISGFYILDTTAMNIGNLLPVTWNGRVDSFEYH